MMKKLMWIILIVLGVSGISYLYQTKYTASHKIIPDPTVQEAVIYIDPASFPGLLQLVDLVKRNDPKMPTLIYWERRTNLPKDFPLLKNATIISRRTITQFGLVKKEERKLENLRQQIIAFASRYPNASFTLHLNFQHPILAWAVLSSIPKKKIKHIYWTEDAFAHTLSEEDDSFLKADPAYFDYLLTQREFGYRVSKFAVLPLYPSTLYLAYPEELKKFNEKKFDYLNKYTQIKAVDYGEIAAGLTEQQKENLLKLAGLSKEHIAYFQQGKPVMLDVLGVYKEDMDNLDAVQLVNLDRVFEGKFGTISNPENYIWLVKEHPWQSNGNELKKAILKKYPFFHFLPKDFPLEILFLAGYVPDKIFGYSSSVFFAVPSEHVLFYIPRGQDPYVPWLLKFGNIAKEQIAA